MTEKELFEDWAKDHNYSLQRLYRRKSRVESVITDHYANSETVAAWHAWQGRKKWEILHGERQSD